MRFSDTFFFSFIRIIFLSIDKVICEDRLLYQNFNVFPEPPGFTVEKLESHLNDYNLQVKQDVRIIFLNIHEFSFSKAIQFSHIYA